MTSSPPDAPPDVAAGPPPPPPGAPAAGASRASVAFAYAACAVIWGTTYFAIRVCIGPGGYATYQAAALRFALAALALWGLVAAGRARPGPRSRAQIAWVCAAGLLNFVGYALTYTAEESIAGAVACVIYGTLPLVTAGLTAATGTERPARSAVVGAVVSLGGIAIIFYDRLEVSARQAAGVAMMLGAVCLSACYNILLKRKGGQMHPIAQNAWFLGTTAAAMAVLALVEARPLPWPPPPAPTFAIAYLAIVGSVVAFGAYFHLIRHTRLMTAATVVLVQPLIALAVDALWEAQPLGLGTYAGAAVTIAGVGANLLSGLRPAPGAPAKAP